MTTRPALPFSLYPFFHVACALLLLPLSLRALDPAKSVFQFNCQNWSRHNGLPADKISAIAQSADGFIWLGTQHGLTRFDGFDFTVTPIALPAAKGHDVRALQAARAGGLWFAIDQGGFGHFDGRSFTALGDDRWSQTGIAGNAILETRDGAIWTGSIFGAARWIEGDPQNSFFEDTLDNILFLAEDGRGRVWSGSAERGLRYYENRKWTAIADEELTRRNINAIAFTPDGDVWVGTNQGLRRYDAHGEFKDAPGGGYPANALLVDRHGVLWIGTGGSGLGRFHHGKLQYLRKVDGLGSDHVTALCEDREGSLWAGTQDGLSQLTDLKFPTYSATEGLIEGAAMTVTASARGGLWIAAANGVSYFDGQTATNYDSPDLLPNRYSRRSFEARNGDLYIADGDKNINVIADGRLLRRHSTETWPETFAEDDESVLIGIGGELVRDRGGRLEPFAFRGEKPVFEWINHLCVARDGSLWVASNNGLFHVADGRFRHWTTEHGFSSRRVQYILEDRDGSIWAGSSAELVRYKDGRLSRLTTADGLHDHRIYAIVPDDHGFFWIASGDGYYRVSRQSLHDFADNKIRRVECRAFNGLDAVKVSDRSDQGYSGCKTTDGRIWFPNPRGVVMIDPSNLLVNHVPPLVSIALVRTGQQEFTGSDAVELEVGETRLEILVNALSYISPKKIRIRYQLEGHDPGWIVASEQRSVAYNHLQPGKYVFRVHAANADGVWNTSGAAITLRLPPPFYRTYWFYAACGLCVAGSLFGAFRWKVRLIRQHELRLRTQNDLLEAKVKARTDELANSVSLLQATLDSTADGVVALHFTGAIVSYNTRFTTMWNLPPEAMASDAALRDASARRTRNPDAFLARIQEIHQREGEHFDVIELADGRIIERYCKPQLLDGHPVGIVMNFRDVTERRRAEEALRASESFLNSLVENLPVHIFRKDRAGRITFANRRYCERYGRSSDDVIGKTAFDLRPAEEAEASDRDDALVMAHAQPYEAIESQTLPSGERRFIQIIKVPVFDSAGQCAGLQGMFLDVTEAKLAESRLAEASALLEAMLENTPDFIYFKDLNSRFVRVSHALLRHVPDPAQLHQLTDFDLFTAEHAQKAFDDEQEIIRTGRPLIGILEKETRRDGSITWVLTTKIPWRNSDGAIIGTFGISRDVTALKDAETKLAEVHRQLLDASRQAGMAEVATGVLHNVGNVLNSVNVSATVIIDQVRESKTPHVARLATLFQQRAADLAAFIAEDPKGRRIPAYLSALAEELASEQRTIVDELEHLRKNIEHIKDIVAMQQSYAKVSGLVEDVSLVELADDALRMNAGGLARHGLEVVRDYQAQPVVSVDRHKVLQILVNTIRNAKYACDESGRVEKRITIRITQDGGRVRIAVVDNGVGIAPENLTRIFGHGFTTRKQGHGFGLHSSALAAQEMGGSLLAHSEGLGHGATFTLELPGSRPVS